MKIAFNARFIQPGKMEGIGWYSFELVKRLISQFPQHEFILLHDRKIHPKPEWGPTVQWHILRPPARHPLLWWIWFEWSVKRFLKKNGVDLFISPDGYACLTTDVPQYLVCHDLAYLHYPKQVAFFVRKYYQYFVPKQLKKAELIFAVSEATKQDIIQQFGISAERIVVAFNGCKEEFKPLSEEKKQQIRSQVSQGADYLLYVGAMHPRKNLVNLVKAFDLFKNAQICDLKLVLLGRKAWMTGELETALQESPYHYEIIQIPYLDKQELAEITAAAWALILPSYLEGFGVPVLEALNCDVPVLVSDRFSLPEVAGPGALIFNPDDPHAITEAIRILFKENDHTHRIELGRIHRTKFNWDQTAEIIAHYIEKT